MGVPLNPNAPEWRPTSQRGSLFLNQMFPHLLLQFHHQAPGVVLPLLQQPVGYSNAWNVTVSAIGEDDFSLLNEMKQRPGGGSNTVCSPVTKKCRSIRVREEKVKPVPSPKKKMRPPRVPPERIWAVKNSEKIVNQVENLPLRPFTCDKHPVFTKTTVMIRNTPNQIRRDFMLKFLDQCCQKYSLEYDFLYLPMDFGKRQNLGYAFVNFTTPAAAVKFGNVLRDYKWSEAIDSRKICDISWARIQGKEALIKRFKDCAFECDDTAFLPVILEPPRNGTNSNPPAPVVLGMLRYRLPEILTDGQKT